MGCRKEGTRERNRVSSAFPELRSHQGLHQVDSLSPPNFHLHGLGFVKVSLSLSLKALGVHQAPKYFFPPSIDLSLNLIYLTNKDITHIWASISIQCSEDGNQIELIHTKGLTGMCFHGRIICIGFTGVYDPTIVALNGRLSALPTLITSSSPFLTHRVAKNCKLVHNCSYNSQCNDLCSPWALMERGRLCNSWKCLSVLSRDYSSPSLYIHAWYP